MYRKTIKLTAVLSTFFAARVFASNEFHPSSFPKNVAKCKGLNRKEGVMKDIDIQYVEVNPSADDTILMVHGWPGLWSNWGRQIIEFQGDYHIVAPDHRGFGSSLHPGDVESSGTMFDLVGDMICVLDNAGVEKAICLGHDWGAQVCWEAARMRPDRIDAVAAAVVPYIPAGPHFVPTAALAAQIPRLTYQLYFQDNTSVAVAELDKDMRRTLRGTYRSVDSPPPKAFLTSKDSFLGAYDDISEIPEIPFLSEEEEDYLVEQYAIQGFKNTLQFYTYGNRYASWKFSHSQSNLTIPQPSLSIFPTQDPVADWEVAAKILGSENFISNLKIEKIQAAHWVQLEKPVEFNAALRRWLETLPASYIEPEESASAQKHLADEL